MLVDTWRQSVYLHLSQTSFAHTEVVCHQYTGCCFLKTNFLLCLSVISADYLKHISYNFQVNMILTASLCGTALCAMYYLKEQYDYTIRRMPPGPPSIPFIGNALSIDCNAPHLSMLELAKKYGDIFSIKLGSQRVVILNSCEVIKEAYKGLDISHRTEHLLHGCPCRR